MAKLGVVVLASLDHEPVKFRGKAGPMRRVRSPAMNNAWRKTASPRLVGPGVAPIYAGRIPGTRPVKYRAPASEVNRLGSPSLQLSSDNGRD